MNQLKIDYEQKFNVNLSTLKIKYDLCSYDNLSVRSVSQLNSSRDYSMRHEDFVIFEETTNCKLNENMDETNFMEFLNSTNSINKNSNFKYFNRKLNTDENLILETNDEYDCELDDETCNEYSNLNEKEKASRVNLYIFNIHKIRALFEVEDCDVYDRCNTMTMTGIKQIKQNKNIEAQNLNQEEEETQNKRSEWKRAKTVVT